MIQVFVQNDDTAHDLFAVVTDLNTDPYSTVLNNQRINRGARVSVDVQEDGSGNCLLQIHTTSADDATVQKDFNNKIAQQGEIISVDVF